MDLQKIESKLQALLKNLNQDSFIYDLLLAYGLPKASVTRLQKGDYNLSKVQGEILWKKKLFFKQEIGIDLHQLIDQLSTDTAIAKQHPRFIVVTDFKSLLSVDTKTGDTLDIAIADIDNEYITYVCNEITDIFRSLGKQTSVITGLRSKSFFSYF